MDYTLRPSLEHTILTKITVTIWNQEIKKIAVLEHNQHSKVSHHEWSKMEINVKKRLLKFPLPSGIKNKLITFIKPIGLQIWQWMEYHTHNDYLGIKLPEGFHWTAQGTIDRKKTSKVLCKNDKIDINTRFKLACIYCNREDILILWSKLCQSCKKSFCYDRTIAHSTGWLLVKCWSLYLAKKVPVIFFPFGFEYALLTGNKPAVQHIWHSLKPEVINDGLKWFARYVVKARYSKVLFQFEKFKCPKQYYTDILWFLLQKMNAKQLTELFETYPCGVLECFLDWPILGLFMEMVNHVKGFLCDKQYYYILKIILEKAQYYADDYYYQNLFRQFWKQIPVIHKRYVIGRLATGSLLKKMFKIKAQKNIMLLLEYSTPNERERIALNVSKNIYRNLTRDKEWDLLKVFLKKCLLSKKVITELVVKKKFVDEEAPEEEKYLWNNFLYLLIEIFYS